MSDYELLKTALLTLDGQCDGARMRDDVGFNGQDSRTGKTLAAKLKAGGNLTPAEQKIGIRMVQKYRATQLMHVVFPNELNYQVQQFGNTATPKAVAKTATPATPAPKVVVETPKHKVFTRNAVVIISLNEKCADFQETLNAVRALPERNWEGYEKEWQAPRRLAPQIVKIFAGKPVDMHYLVPQYAAEQEEAERKIAENNKKWATHWGRLDFLTSQAKAIAPSSPVEVKGLGIQLRPYQQVPVECFRVSDYTGRVINDDMGVGKTFEALAMALDYFNHQEELNIPTGPLFIICPPALAHNWVSEIKRALPQPKYGPVMLTGTVPFGIPVSYAKVFIIPDSSITAWEKEIIKAAPEIVIADEAHRFKDPKSQRSKSYVRIARKTRINLPMTGTPIENSPQDFWVLLSAADYARWGDLDHFKRNYCEYSSQLRQLSRDAMPYITRRKLNDCGAQIPPKTRSSYLLPMSEQGRILYEERMERYFLEMEEKENRGQSTAGSHLQFIEAMKQAAWEGKKDGVLDLVTNFLESCDEKLVFCALHIEAIAYVQKHLENLGVKFIRITGQEVGSQIKQENVLSFQKDPSVRVALISIKAGGLGHTLTAAATTLTAEFWWTPTSHDQIEGRTYRMTQNSHTNMWYALAKDTIDTMIFDKLNTKLAIMDTVLGEESLPFNPQDSILNEIIDQLWREREAKKAAKKK